MNPRTMQLAWIILGVVWLILVFVPYMPANDCITRAIVCLAAAAVIGVRQ